MTKKNDYMFSLGKSKGKPHINVKGSKGWKRYVYRPGASLEEYVGQYKKKGTFNRKTGFKWKIAPAKHLLRHAELSPKTENAIKQGIGGTATIPNLKTADMTISQAAYKMLLRPLVKDDLLLDVLSHPLIVEKFKHRLSLEVTARDASGNDTTLHFRAANKTIENARTELWLVMEREALTGDMIVTLQEQLDWLIDWKNMPLGSCFPISDFNLPFKKLALTITYAKG